MSAKVRLQCPHCYRIASTTRDMKRGVWVRCPTCKKAFAYEPARSTKKELVRPAEKAAAVAEVVTPELYSPPERLQPPPAAPVAVVNVNVPAPRKRNSIAIAALVMGIIAALICWVAFQSWEM